MTDLAPTFEQSPRSGFYPRTAALAMKRGKSVDFTGYWQRHVAG
jgi:hypothetical protein